MQLAKLSIPLYLAAVLVLVTLSVSPAKATNTDIDIEGVPLPANVSPLPTDASGSPFAGTWIGLWDGILKTILVVESVNADGEASVVYAVADSPHGHFKAAWFRMDAVIEDKVLTTRDTRLSVRFEVSRTGRLKAIFGNGASFAQLNSHELDTLRNPDTQIAWSPGVSELVQTELIEDGKPVSLEVVIFKPTGDGPFPLAVVNHGSTGSGKEAAVFANTWTNPWFAEAMNERGWLVAFPQRRGRGKSDGLYDEGFSADRSKGYTCTARRSLAGADRALEDIDAAVSALQRRTDVDDGPMLISGVSRGGVLSVAYAGLHPKQTHAVINFVGGWIGDDCDTADEINQTLFTKGAGYTGDTLWLYGQDDVFYSMQHSRKNFKAFQQAGGKGEFLEFTVGGTNNGHWVMSIPPLWQQPVKKYLDRVGN